MKLLIFLFPFLMFTQDHIQIEIHQDARLMFLGDDKGNRHITQDIKLSVALQGKQFEWYYFELKPSLEYANLKGGKFVTWTVQGGWVFNQLFIRNIEAGIYPTIGLLHRFNTSYFAYGITSELNYKITEKLKIGLMLQGITRPDLKDKWNTKGLKPSGYLGIKYVIK